MSFWTGFTTGLAKSVDQGLQKAMSKRDDELSRAKTFWQTRQAQKLDQKDKYDARAEKAMRRMITEAKGDTTLALAAWNAAGGDADGNEKFLERLDATRASKGKFGLTDAITMPDDYVKGDNKYSSEDLIKSVGMNLPEFDKSRVSVSDFGKGTMFALRKDAGQEVADSLGNMTPEKVSAITGIPKATLDMSRMLEAEKYAQDQKLIAKQLTPTLSEALAANTEKVMSLDPTAPNFDELNSALLTEEKMIISAIGKEAKAKDTGAQGGLTTPTLNTIYQAQLTRGLVTRGINTKEGTFRRKDGSLGNSMADTDEWIGALAEATNDINNDFVSTLRRSDGSYGPAASNLIGTNKELNDVANSLDGKTTDAPAAATKSDNTKNKPLFDTLDSIGKNQSGFAADIFSKLPDVNNKKQLQNLFNKLIDSGASSDEANIIIGEAQSNEIKNRTAKSEKYSGFVMPGSDTSVDITVDKEGAKTAGKYSWNPDYAPSMPKLMKDKSVPNSIRNAVLEDYMKLQISMGRNISLEDVKTQFGIE